MRTKYVNELRITPKFIPYYLLKDGQSTEKASVSKAAHSTRGAGEITTSKSARPNNDADTEQNQDAIVSPPYSVNCYDGVRI